LKACLPVASSKPDKLKHIGHVNLQSEILNLKYPFTTALPVQAIQICHARRVEAIRHNSLLNDAQVDV